MLKVVKIGGNVVDNPQALEAFLADFAALEGPKILVHGGGKIASAISRSLGIEPVMIEGRRVTDEATIEVVTMVYAGLINKQIVNKLNALGCRAVGLSGADGGLIVSHRRSPEPVDYGFVGDPEKINTDLMAILTQGGYTVVVAPITTDGSGTLLNTNADTVAQSVAVAMSATRAVELVYCFEKPGVLADKDDDGSVIPEINERAFAQMKVDGTVSDGMIPKLDNAFSAIRSGVSRVVICSSDAVHGRGGTVITL